MAYWPLANMPAKAADPARANTGVMNVSDAANQRLALSASTPHCYVENEGSNMAFVAFGDSGVTVTAGTTPAAGASVAADGLYFPIPPGFVGVINRSGLTHVAAICVTAQTTVLRFTPGYGQ
jgi:hypothetical protein